MYKKNIKRIKWGAYTLFLLFVSSILVSCGDENIVIGEADKFPYQSANESYACLQHVGSANKVLNIDVRANDVKNVLIALTKAGEKDVAVTIKVDPSLVASYNKANFTRYELFPAQLMSIDNGGNVTVKKWTAESEPIGIHFTKDDALEGKTYLLPMVIQSQSGANISAQAQVIYYVINVDKPVPSTNKGWDGVSICYVEVNSNNPLNVGTYTLKTSGKPFFDICNIFAANMNYNAETGKTYLHFNENVQHLLSNRDKYIKPLQDKGIKVCLSILPNHGGVGMLNLTNTAAKEFALEIKAAVDAYGLDGVDFDEEWADYGTNGLPGSNGTSYGRLLFEVRKLLPKPKIVTVYYIGVSGLGTTVEGVNPGDLIDYSYYPYYGSWSGTPTSSVLGLTNKQWGPYPYAFHGTNGNTAYPAINTSYINNIKSTYGVVLMYDIRGFSKTHETAPNKGIMDYSDRLTIYSNILYGEEVEAGEIYLKDW